ncbi:MAG: hypothetical protein GF344_14270 [Chitinivibrionales bacterium]|nr:hypothetical protein [Chitinivibrionales bacterium]MBD3357893.1 hypothetical protein [Chitinivibrionales bacterium]
MLSEEYQLSFPEPEFKRRNPDGSLDMESLLKEFRKFRRRHADAWELKADDTEAFPHFLAMVLLKRVINGGGGVEREYALGGGRVDLAIEDGGTRAVVEIKLVHPTDGREGAKLEGIAQTNRCRTVIKRKALACLIFFDRTPAGRKKSREERTTWEVVTTEHGKMIVVGG